MLSAHIIKGTLDVAESIFETLILLCIGTIRAVMILIMVARPEKLQLRFIRFCTIMRSMFAMRVVQTCILMAFALSP